MSTLYSTMINSQRMNMKWAGTMPEFDIAECSPERRLWLSVIITAVEEYKHWCTQIELAWRINQTPVTRLYFQALDALRRECSHRWFTDICDMADISRDLVFNKFNELDREYCIKAVPINPEIPRLSLRFRSNRVNKDRRLKQH